VVLTIDIQEPLLADTMEEQELSKPVELHTHILGAFASACLLLTVMLLAG